MVSMKPSTKVLKVKTPVSGFQAPGRGKYGHIGKCIISYKNTFITPNSVDKDLNTWLLCPPAPLPKL